MSEDNKKEIKQPTEQDLKKADEQVRIIVLTRGELDDGRPFYAYMLMPPSKYPKFLEVEKQGNYMLEDYGEIVSFGHEKNPPPEVVIEMYRKYGAHPDYVDDLKKEVNRLIDEFEESKRTGGLPPGKIKDILKKKKPTENGDKK